MSKIKVGTRVRFIGPEYRFTGGYPRIGVLGVVTERAGHCAQGIDEAGNLMPKVELVTVHFSGDERPTVLDIGRIEAVDGEVACGLWPNTEGGPSSTGAMGEPFQF